MKINNKEIKGSEFFYDDCHKIYIIEDEKDKKYMYKNGWKEDDIYPITRLREKYIDSCPLRFISNVKLTIKYVDQGEKAKFSK